MLKYGRGHSRHLNRRPPAALTLTGPPLRVALQRQHAFERRRHVLPGAGHLGEALGHVEQGPQDACNIQLPPTEHETGDGAIVHASMSAPCADRPIHPPIMPWAAPK